MPPLNDSPVLALLLFAGLFGAAYGVGRLLTGRIPHWDSLGERVAFAVPIGMGVIGYLVLVLGLMRLLFAPVFAVILIAGLGGWAMLARDVLAGRKAATGQRSPVSPVAVAVWAVVGFIGVATAVAALAPPGATEWDGLSYHLANPKVWLNHGRIFYLPWDHHSNFPFTLEMLFLVMMGLGSIGAAKLCHWACGALLVASVYHFARRHLGGTGRGSAVGRVAALMLASTPVVIWEASVSYIDLATALFTWLSLYALVNSSAAAETGDEKTSVPWLVLSAVSMGFALGTKYTVLGFWGMLLVGILGWHLAVRRSWSPKTIPHAALWGAVSLAVGAPWYVKNVLYTGNPVYPFAYGLFGGRYWNAENAAAYAAEQVKFGIGKTPVDLLLGPWQSTMLPSAASFTEYYVFALSPVFVALLLTVPLVARRLSRPSAYLLLFGVGVYGFWFFLMQQTRYFVPALPAYALVGADVLLLLWDDRKAIARGAAAGLVMLSALWGALLAGGLAFWGVEGVQGETQARPAWPFVSGQMGRDAYLETRLPGLYPAIQFINANTPPDAKVILLRETRGLYLDREYVWGEPLHAAGLVGWERYASGDEMAADFKRRGYTTILLGPAPPKPDTDTEEKVSPEPPRWQALLDEAVSGGKAQPVYERGFVVLRIP